MSHTVIQRELIRTVFAPAALVALPAAVWAAAVAAVSVLLAASVGVEAPVVF